MPVVALAAFAIDTVWPLQIFELVIEPALCAVEYTGISTVVLTGVPHPKVAVRR